MADVRCQMCGRVNEAEAEVCEFCGARIRPVLAAMSMDSGEAPVGENERPAETPRPENPPSSISSTPPASPTSPGVTGGLPSRADKALSWLAGLRSQGPVEATPEAEPEKSAGEQEPQDSMDASDWLSRLGGEATPPEPPAEAPGEAQDEAQIEATLPAWLSDSLIQPPVEMKAEEPAAAEEAPVQPEPAEAKAEEPVAAEAATAWLEPPEAKAQEQAPAAAEETPAPPEQVEETTQETAVAAASAQAELTQEPAEEKPSAAETTSPIAGTGALPDWLSNVRPGGGDGTLAALFGDEPQAEGGPAGETPPVQPPYAEGGMEAPEEEAEAAPGATPPAEPGLPVWLADLGGIPPTGETPILADEGTPPGKEDKGPASLEMPDWLSKVQPEPEEAAPKKEEAPAAPDEAGEVTEAELPAWVQAMRPVESVVAESTSAHEEAQFIEQTGPLAGLRGVLPAGPGLGPLRRPPTYLSKLEVSEGQQRYAASLEQLVAGETRPRKAEAAKPTSKRLWRWLITLCLFLAIGVTLLGGAQVVPGTALPYSDAGAAATLISGLPAGAPVLVAFDYDPALAGELEATAAPFLGELIGNGTPLAFLSTSPTGPALAEHFMQAALAGSGGQSQNADRYVNLGYLAGGPAGMGYFADNPTGAMPVTAGGSPAWSTGPLQGVQQLDDFSAFIILTDNADTARNWIEQTSLRLGNVPLVMIISAQAEPIIRPYFESGQLKGLISGLADAQLAEQASGVVGLASTYWSAYSVGILIAVLLIVFGAIGNAFIGRGARRKNPGGEV